MSEAPKKMDAAAMQAAIDGMTASDLTAEQIGHLLEIGKAYAEIANGISQVNAGLIHGTAAMTAFMASFAPKTPPEGV